MSRVEILTIEEAMQYANLLSSDDHEFIATLTAERRRREVIAWRSLLRWMVGEGNYPIRYDSVGAPYLVGSELFISVSHSRTHVAVVVSDTKCAVDIESLDRDFKRVASRYATADELTLLANTTIDPALHLPLIWSAKEAMYKLSGRQGLDLLNDLAFTAVTIENMQWQLHENHIVVFMN